MKPASPGDLSAMMAMLGGAAPQEEAAPPVEAAPEPPKRWRRPRVIQIDDREAPEQVVLPALPPEPEVEPEVLTEEQFHAALGGWDGVKRCLEASDIPMAARRVGAVTVSFEIGSGGAVVGSKALDGPSGELTTCIERQARRLAFRLSAEPRKTVTRKAKFVFVGKGARLVM